MPEPLLTRNLNPFFEAAMTAENDLISASFSESSVHDRGLRGLRKPPSLSTLALPTFNVRKHSASLLASLANLIAQLPVEHRDLLKTVTELIRATAACSKETKMPLSNLLVVFCPSLTMSPPLLRVLCEGEGIWDGPVEEVLATETDGKGQEESKGTNEKSEQSDQDDALEINVRPRASIRKMPVSVVATPDDTESQLHTPSSIDKSLPILPQHDMVISRGTEPISDISTPPLTSTSTSTGSPDSAMDNEGVSPEPMTPSKPRMRKQSDLPFRSVRKSHISGPIPFPMTGSAPTTPVGLRPTLTLSTSSSSPNLGPASASAASPPSSGSVSRRRTRPSLHDLLPKRSLSSLLSRPLSTFSPIDPPMTAAADVHEFSTEPLTRTVSECPVLDIPVMHSPIKMEMDLGDGPYMLGDATTPDAAVKRSSVEDKQQAKKASNETARLRVDMSEATLNRISSTSSTAPTIFYTPLTQPMSLTPAPSLSTANSSDSYSFLDLRFKDAEECENDDWAKSVLMAASTNPDVNKTAITATTTSS